MIIEYPVDARWFPVFRPHNSVQQPGEAGHSWQGQHLPACSKAMLRYGRLLLQPVTTGWYTVLGLSWQSTCYFAIQGSRYVGSELHSYSVGTVHCYVQFSLCSFFQGLVSYLIQQVHTSQTNQEHFQQRVTHKHTRHNARYR